MKIELEVPDETEVLIIDITRPNLPSSDAMLVTKATLDIQHFRKADIEAGMTYFRQDALIVCDHGTAAGGSANLTDDVAPTPPVVGAAGGVSIQTS